MKYKFSFFLKQFMKMVLQNLFLPLIYDLCCFWNRSVDEKLVLFADSHHSGIPFSMERMNQAVQSLGYKVDCYFYDSDKEGTLKSVWYAVSFMNLYSKARYVFICDNFLPVAACRKRKGTTVVQLWHSCGLLKKMGYDTSEDVPSFYKGNVYRNYDLVTVSAPCCVPCLTSGMRLSSGIVKPVGVSRTDFYFNQSWTNECREDFYKYYPNAIGKKILLWAPTFRGNAASPYLVGIEEVRALSDLLDKDWMVIIKSHPHLDRKEMLSNCTIPSERLLPVTDLLITDYSSVLFDFLFFQKPFVLYAPDLKQYEEQRGFYIPYQSLTRHIVTDESQLALAVQEAYQGWKQGVDLNSLQECMDYHNRFCDGHATERIINLLKMRKP